VLCWGLARSVCVANTHRALDAAEGETDGGVPVLRRLLDEVVDGVADLAANATSWDANGGRRRLRRRLLACMCWAKMSGAYVLEPA